MYQEEGCLKAAGYVCGREGADGTCSYVMLDPAGTLFASERATQCLRCVCAVYA